MTINPVLYSEDGQTKFVVKTITADAIKAAAGSNAEVTTLIIGPSDEPVDIELGAASPDSEPITVIVPLDMLDDYSTMLALKENVDAGLVLAYAVPANMFWTFACGVDVDLPDGVDAYTCSITAAGEVKITLIPDEDLKVNGKRTIKHNNGVLLFNTSETGGTYEMIGRLNGQMITKPATGNNMDYANNWLEPVIASKNYPAADYYVLKDNEFCEIEDNASMTPACKALLRTTAPKAAAARQLSINK